MPESESRQFGLLWGGVVVFLILLSPLAPHLAGGLWSCPFKTLTGLPCPGCGTTRAALALAALDPWHAIVRYPLPTLAWFVFLCGGLIAGWRAWLKKPLPQLPRRLPIRLRIGIVVIVMANWGYSIVTGV